MRINLGPIRGSLSFDIALWYEPMPEIGERRYVLFDVSFINGEGAFMFSVIAFPVLLNVGFAKKPVQ